MTCRKCSTALPAEAVYCHQCGAKQVIQKRKSRKRANGTGTAVKRPGSNKWTLYVVLGYDPQTGRAVRRCKGGFATQTEALAYAPILKGAPDEKPKTLTHYHTLWEKGAELSESKETAYRIAWRRLRTIHHTPVGSLTIGMLQNIVDTETSTHYPAKDMRQVLSNLFNLAVADGQARINLAPYITVPPLNEEEGEAFTEDELLRIWLAYDDGVIMYAYMLVMIYTGMMPGELMNLEKSKIDLDNRIISGAGLKTKERKKKPLVIPKAIVAVFEDIIERVDGDLMYPYHKTSFYKQYNDAITRLEGVRPLPPYSCRHTTGTALALSSDTPPAVIQRVMRHSKFSSTEKYIHPDYKSALAAVDAAFK